MTPPWNGPERRKNVDPRWLQVSDEICREQEILIDQITRIEEKFDRKFEAFEIKFDQRLDEIEHCERAERVAIMAKLTELTMEMREVRNMALEVINESKERRKSWDALRHNIITGVSLTLITGIISGIGWTVSKFIRFE